MGPGVSPPRSALVGEVGTGSVGSGTGVESLAGGGVGEGSGVAVVTSGLLAVGSPESKVPDRPKPVKVPTIATEPRTASEVTSTQST